jgi:hypothetical protein
MMHILKITSFFLVLFSLNCIFGDYIHHKTTSNGYFYDSNLFAGSFTCDLVFGLPEAKISAQNHQISFSSVCLWSIICSNFCCRRPRDGAIWP